MNSKPRTAFLLLLVFLSFCFSSSMLYAAEAEQKKTEETYHSIEPLIPEDNHPGYTINFNNVSIIEFVKFLSKIAKVNFIYNEQELQFNVTIVSEEPTRLVNVMAGFIQVLRIHGFDLIEQGNNLVISRTGSIRQIATVVSQEMPLEEGQPVPPIMTRVFKVRNANPGSLADLVKPLLSEGAILEVSMETRHIIITDITQNIEEIQRLFISLDASKSSLTLESYITKNNSPEDLITLANQLITPISEGNPLILVPQDRTNTVFIVSTPYLVEKTLAVLEDLDSPPSLAQRFSGPITGDNILIYHIQNKPADVLQAAVRQVESNLTQMGPGADNLVDTLKTMKYIRGSHALLFTGPTQSLSEVKAMLGDLDIPYTAQELEYVEGGFLVYKIKYGDEEQIARSLEKLVDNLKKSPYPDRDLIKTIDSMKWIKENDSLVFTGDQRSLDKLKKLLPTFDIPLHHGRTAGKLPLSNDFYIYTPKYQSGEELLKQVQDTYKNLKDSGLAAPAFLHALNSAKWSPSSDTLVFTGDAESLDRIHKLMATMDHPIGPAPEETTLFVYKVKFVEPNYIEQGLQKLAKSLPSDSALATTIDNGKYISESHSFVFRGPVSSIERIKEILATLDNQEVAEEEAEAKQTYFVYKLQYASGAQVMKELDQTSKSLKAPSKEISEVIKHAKWIESTNSIVLTGPHSAVEKVKAMIAQYDTTRPEKNSFFVYTPTNMTAADFQREVIKAGKDMAQGGLEDPQLIHAMESATVVSNGKSVMFTGTPDGIDKLKELAKNFDLFMKEHPKNSEFFLYKPQNITPEQLKKDVLLGVEHLKEANFQDPQLIRAMESIQIDSKKDRVMFVGTPEAIDKLRPMIKNFDSHEGATQPGHFYIYKPTYQSPEFIIDQARHTASEMKDSGLTNSTLIDALDSGSVVSQGTAVLFTGTEPAIKTLTEIVPTLDVPKKAAVAANEFYVYKPVHVSADELRRHARMVGNDMESSNFGDPTLIQTLHSARLVSNGKAVMFTGTADSILKLKELLPSLDTPTDEAMKQVGTIIRIYKIKYTPGPILMEHLRNIANDLAQANSTDKNLIDTLNNMRYVKDTNSLIFTGTPEAVAKAEAFAEKFDIPGLAQEAPARSPTGFLIYKPKYVPGEELIQILRDFEQNLITSNVNERGLFDVINHLRWMEKTSTILISGDQDDTQKVLSLLERFDVPGPGIPEGEPGIETVSDLSFLIYKLQYHSGSEIQSAIKRIGDDLSKSKSKSNENLSDAINSLQYIEITNSLISTGQPEALAKLKELIKSIDVPLKQVFVEVLVLETTMGNALSFGLRWGSQGQYRNKFGYGTGSFPIDTANNPDNLRNFNGNLHDITADTTPTGSFIPFTPGFDLGIIGDIILHKGNSYFALGSLVNALRTDGDTTIVLNQKLITQDNKNSTLFIGQNVPYTGSLVTNSSSTTVQTANLEYRDVGVNLSITPTIGNNDIITLAIEQDISEQVNPDVGSTTSTDSVTGITTNKTSTQTVVSVPDKSFLIISGQIQDSTTHNRTSIPCLGGLPLIGAFFSEQESNYNNTNIVIFIRPHLIKSFDTYKEITEDQEGLYRSQSNAEDFDTGLELVKTPDDA